ncbi:molybdenum cofactor guanylyltransferase [Citricoccus nitrophenolicus]|uniref:molybdenum cofactor guanylyltransferase n=1 Tax=Citricoccus nitrophenolicus TaxID=863575 RepID=UPI0039B54282
MALAVVILAGGASRRMGRDKASLVLAGAQGASLLERTVAAARSAGATQIVVVGDRPVPGSDDLHGVLFVREDPPRSGPVPALDTALAEVDADLVMVLPCDLAHPREACRELVNAMEAIGAAAGPDAERESSTDGVVAVDAGGHRQHLTALFHTETLRRTATPGSTRVRERVAGLVLVEVPEPAGLPEIWDDMDTPEDVERIRTDSGNTDRRTHP